MICLFLHQVFSFEVVPYSCLSSVNDVSYTNPLAKRQSVPSMISLSETTAVFTGRSVLSKHKGFSLYRLSALLLAQTIGDMPLYFVMIVMFTLIIYFMTGLQVDPVCISSTSYSFILQSFVPLRSSDLLVTPLAPSTMLPKLLGLRS